MNLFLELSKKGETQKKEITEIVFNKFFNLNWTASFIEGYCKKCIHIEPFLFSIEHSLVLAFQKDYEGGIKTLIPVIEGILRKYLAKEKNATDFRFQVLRKSFLDLQNDLIAKSHFTIANFFDSNHQYIAFSTHQINTLNALNTQYYEGWFSFIVEFIDNSFYLKTEGENITTQINRHVILHELDSNVSYNLENYIKVYFVINFLTWIFLRKEGKSIFPEIDGLRFFEKAMAYKSIIETSEKLTFQKHLLYKNYKGYNQDLIREKFNVTFDNVPKLFIYQYRLQRKIASIIWKKKF